MPYKIAGIDVHKKMLHVSSATSKSMANTSLSDGGLTPAPASCAHLLTGCLNNRSRK